MIHPNLSLLDYQLFALILAVLFLTSSVEYVLLTASKSDGLLTPGRIADYKKASTWAFVGILFSAVLGIIAQSDLRVEWEVYGLPIPILSLLLWAFYHRSASITIDLAALAGEVDAHISAVALDYVKANGTPKSPVSLDCIYEGCKSKIKKPLYLGRGLRNVSVPLKDLTAIADAVLYTPEKLETVLKELVKRGELCSSERGYYVSLRIVSDA